MRYKANKNGKGEHRDGVRGKEDYRKINIKKKGERESKRERE